jgi:hypothetical protein
MLLIIEFALTTAALLLALTFPNLASPFFQRIELHLANLARRRLISVAVIGVLALGARIACLPAAPLPKPFYHDDFCYLLAADTFSRGRLTNPPHPMWQHFETFGVIQQPTYQCIAQPGQGLMLAFGKVALGNPFWGVWLSVGLMCAAICWMLQAWMPARWALLGGAIAIARFGVFGYWANTYWGGALGALGGALVVGALPRIKLRLTLLDSLLFGLGLIVLANTRPYEGFVLSLCVCGILCVWMITANRQPLSALIRRFVLPVSAILLVAAFAMGYYNWRVTHNPFEMAYNIEAKNYGVAPYFVWQQLKSPRVFRHALIRNMYEIRQVQAYHNSRSFAGVLVKFIRIWRFYFGPAFTIALIGAFFSLPANFGWKCFSRPTRSLLIVSAITAAALAGESFFEAHYASPLTACFVALPLLAMRRLARWRRRGKRTGLFLVRAIFVICALSFFLRAAAKPLHVKLTTSTDPAWFEYTSDETTRTAVLAQLQQIPGSHLVIVVDDPNQVKAEDFVYNEADIDNARVVWARDMGPKENATLIRYFKNRQVWTLEADGKPPRLVAEGVPSK